MTGPSRASQGDVFARERQEHIARIVEEHGRARVTELAAQFGVSGVTIRKDLVVLEAEHRLVRTHGGALAVDREQAGAHLGDPGTTPDRPETVDRCGGGGPRP